MQGDVSTPSPSGVIPGVATILEGIGQQKYIGDHLLQLPDVIALQETTSNSTSVVPLVSSLNTFYGSTIFGSSAYQATTSDGVTVGGGPNALIYNQQTLNLMASVGVGTPMSATNGMYRQVVRYELQPIADKGTNVGAFYVYDSHYKSGAGNSLSSGVANSTLRNGEAKIIRNDEAVNLPAGASVLYVGDYNGDGSAEPAYQTMTAAASPGGIVQGAGIDPLNPTNDYTQDWTTAAYKSIMTDSVATLNYRDDLQLMTSNVYNGTPGSLSYVGNSYHVFGNNGTTAKGAAANLPTNTSINDINGNGTLTSTQVLAAMNKSTGSDHMAVVADYTITTSVNGIWLGGTGNWSTASGWSNGVIPNYTTLEVKIDNGNAVASVVTLDQDASIANLVVDTNDKLIIAAGHLLTLSGPAASQLNGVVTSAGTIRTKTTTNSGTFSSTGILVAGGNFTNSGTAVFGGSQSWAGTTLTNTAGTATFTTNAGAGVAAPPLIDVTGGSVTFASGQLLTSLTLAEGGLVTVSQQANHANHVLITTGQLVFGGGTNAWQGRLDSTSNDLDVKHGSLTDLTNQVQQGFNIAGGGNWNGSGGIITSSAGTAGGLTALGVIQNSVDGTPTGQPLYGSATALGPFDGAYPVATDVLIKYTYYGDANLDGQVDGSDYTRIDSAFGGTATGWFNGDFNYDGKIDGSDYTLIDNAFNTQGNNLSTSAVVSPSTNLEPSPASGSTTAVPEPTGLASFALAANVLLAKRRRSKYLETL